MELEEAFVVTKNDNIPPNARRMMEAMLSHMASPAVSDATLDGMIEWADQLAQALRELKIKRGLAP